MPSVIGLAKLQGLWISEQGLVLTIGFHRERQVEEIWFILSS